MVAIVDGVFVTFPLVRVINAQYFDADLFDIITYDYREEFNEKCYYWAAQIEPTWVWNRQQVHNSQKQEMIYFHLK